jgi:hypothetical protein
MNRYLQFPRVSNREDAASLAETLAIMADRKLFDQGMKASETLEADLKRGDLHSLDRSLRKSVRSLAALRGFTESRK